MHPDEASSENEALLRRYGLGLYIQLLEREFTDVYCTLGVG